MDHLGAILDEHRKSSTTSSSSSSRSLHNATANGGASSLNASVSSPDQLNTSAAADILAVTPSPPPKKKRSQARRREAVVGKMETGPGVPTIPTTKAAGGGGGAGPKARKSAKTAKTKAKTKTKTKTTKVQSLKDKPPPLAELAIRTRSTTSSRCGSSRGGGGGGDDSVLAVCSVASGRSGRSGKSGRSSHKHGAHHRMASTNPFDDTFDEYADMANVTMEEDDDEDAASASSGGGESAGEGSVASSMCAAADDASAASLNDSAADLSSAASSQVSELSIRSARSLALQAAVAARAELENVVDDDGRWEEGSDGEWRKVPSARKGEEEEEEEEEEPEKELWEEGSDGEWRKVVVSKKTVKGDAAKKEEEGRAAAAAAASKDSRVVPVVVTSPEEEEEEGVWEEDSDGEWRMVPKKEKEKEVTPVASDDRKVAAIPVTKKDNDVDAGEKKRVPPAAMEVTDPVSLAAVPTPAAEVQKDRRAEKARKATTATRKKHHHRRQPTNDSEGDAPNNPFALSSSDDDEVVKEEPRQQQHQERKVPPPPQRKVPQQKLNPFDDSSSSSSEDEEAAAADQQKKSHLHQPESQTEKENLNASMESRGSGPIDLDDISSSSDSSDDDVMDPELDDELWEQLQRHQAEAAAKKQAEENRAVAEGKQKGPVHPLLAEPTTPLQALDRSARPLQSSANTSPSGPSLLARARAKKEAEDRIKAELAEKRAREREAILARGGIPGAIGGNSFDQDSSQLTPSQKSHEVSTTANSTTQRSLRSYGEQSDASSANAVAILPSLVNVQPLTELNRIPSGHRVDQFSSSSPGAASSSHVRGESHDSGTAAALNAQSARDAIMAAASRHRSRFGSSRPPSSRGSFDSQDRSVSVSSGGAAAAAAAAAGPSPASSLTGRPPLLDRSSKAASLGKKFMTPLERQRELRRSQRMAASATVAQEAASVGRGRLQHDGPGLKDGLTKLNAISGDEVSVAARGDGISVAPSLGGTVATEGTKDIVKVAADASAKTQDILYRTDAAAAAASSEHAEGPVLRDFNGGLLVGFKAPTESSPSSSPDRSAASPSPSPTRSSRVKRFPVREAKSKMKNVFDTMARVDEIKKQGGQKKQVAKKPPKPQVQNRREQVKPELKKIDEVVPVSEQSQREDTQELNKKDEAAPPEGSSPSFVDPFPGGKDDSDCESSSLDVAVLEEEEEEEYDDSSDSGGSITFGVPLKPVSLPLRSHPEYSKYFAMLKASVPPAFVRRVCEIDGRDPAILDLDPDTPYDPDRGSKTSSPPVLTIQEEDDESDEAEDKEEVQGQQQDAAMGLEVVTDQGVRPDPSSALSGPSPRGIADIKQSSPSVKASLPATKAPPESAQAEAAKEEASTPKGDVGGRDTSNVAALFASRGADNVSVVPKRKPGKLADSGRGDVAALFASRAANTDPVAKPKPGKLGDSGKGDVAALFAARAAEGSSAAAADKPKPGKLADSGRGDVAALFASRAAENEPVAKPKPGKLGDSGKGDVAALFAARAGSDAAAAAANKPKPGKLSDSGKGDVAALFAARAKESTGSSQPAVSLSTPVSAAAKKIEQKEEENKAATRPPLNKDPEFSKYFKMLSMGIPVGAVQQALVKDGKDPAIVDMDADKPYAPEPTAPERPPLRDDPEFAKYFRMLKMGLPMGAVKQAMTRDGMDPSIMDMDHEKPLSTPAKDGQKGTTTGTPAKKKTPQPKVLRKKLFWTSIDKSKLDKDSLWAQAQQESQNLEGLDYDLEEFANLFTQQNSKKGKNGKSPARDAQKRRRKVHVQLIDGRREMNGSILLKKFKHDYKQLADDLEKLDVGNMDENEVRAHMQLLPTKEEAKKIEEYLAKSKTDSEKEEAIAKLGECEKYMLAMMGVQDAAKKFECMLYRSQFDSRVAELEVEVKDLKEACKCVRSSDKLRKLLVFALRLGNTLNTGGSGESASAITLDSLLKMHEAKAFDKQTSVLHYLVSIIEKNDKEVLNVKDDLEPAKKAERIVVESLKKSLADLSNGLDAVNDMGMEEAQRQAEAKGDTNVLADVNAVLKQTNIGQFAISAHNRLTQLSGELNEAVEACTGLLTYFGEDAVMPSDVFFSTLNGFIAMFGKALEDIKRKEKARLRKEKLAEKQKKEGGLVKKSSFGQMSDSETSLADSRSKILQELSMGDALCKDKRLRRRQQRKNQEDNNRSSSTTKSKHSSPSSPPQTVAGGKGEDKSSQGQGNDRALAIAIATPTGAGDIDLEKGNDGDAPPDRTLIPFFGADEELEIAAPTPEDAEGDKEGSGDKAPKTQWSPGFLQRNAQQKRCPECSMILLADGKCECQKVKDNDIDNDNDNDNRTLEAASASIGQAGFTFQLPATDQSNEGNRKETLEAASASIGPSGFTFQPPATDRSNEGDSNKTLAAASASIGPSGFTFQPPATDRSNEGDSNKTLAAASASIGPSGFTFQPTMFPGPDDDCDTQYDAEEKKHQDEQQQPVQQQEEEGVVATPEQTREVDGTTSTSASASGTTTTPPVEGVVSQNLSRHSSTPGSVANDEQAGVEADDEDVALDESKADAAIFVLGIDNIKAPEPPVQKDVEEVEDEDAGLTPDVIAGLSYNELRSTCKSHGLPANGKALDLKERLLQHCSSSQGNVEEKEEDEEEEKQTEQVDGKGDDGNDKSMETDDTREEGIESSEGAQKEEDEDSGLTTTTTEGTGANSNIDSTYTFDMNSSYGKQFMEMAIALFLQNDNGSRSVSVRDSSSDLMDEVRSFIATECSLSFAQGGMPATDDAIHVFLTNAIEKVIRVAADLSGRGRRISFPKDVAMAFFFNHAFPGESTVSPPSDCSCSTVQFVRFKPAEVEWCLQLQVKYVDHPGYFDIEAKDLCTRHYIEFEPLMQILATLLKSRRANIPVGCRAEVSASINRSAMPLSDCVKKCVMMLPDSLISDDEKRTLEPLLSDKSFDISQLPTLLRHNVGHVGARREKDHSTSGGDGIDHKAMSMGGHMLGVFASGQTLHCVYIDGENNQITDPVAEYGTRDRTSDGLADLDIDRFLKLYSVFRQG